MKSTSNEFTDTVIQLGNPLSVKFSATHFCVIQMKQNSPPVIFWIEFSEIYTVTKGWLLGDILVDSRDCPSLQQYPRFNIVSVGNNAYV